MGPMHETLPRNQVQSLEVSNALLVSYSTPFGQIIFACSIDSAAPKSPYSCDLPFLLASKRPLESSIDGNGKASASVYRGRIRVRTNAEDAQITLDTRVSAHLWGIE